jgi:ribosomal protein S18 acetylase RimI-like enzyme
MMTGLILAAAVTLSPALLAAPEAEKFGTDYYDTVVRGHFHERVQAAWPGPTGLLNLWRSGKLGSRQRVALLLGGAAFHDPQLLPAYREGLLSGNAQLRKVAAYGYRDLIGDDVPNVRGGVSPEVARSLVGELDAVARTTRRAALIDIWLVSLLASEGHKPPDWRGITFAGSPARCLKAVERLAGPEDLGSVVGTYQLSEERVNRVSLMRLIEGLSMGRLVVKPQGEGQGWGSKVYDEAFERLERWLSYQCDLGVFPVLQKAFLDLGVRGLDPLSPAACDVWLQILIRGRPTSWAMAADRLYLCGGPAIRLSLARPETERNRDVRKRLRLWYGN